MALGYTVVCLLAGLFLLGLVRAEVGLLQRQHRLVASYPAAGYKPTRQFRLPADQPKPARLVANSEAQEDLDDAAEELTPRPNAAPGSPPPPAPVPAAVPAIPVTPTIAYYPAGAVGFVRPATFAKIVTAPQPVSAYGATPQYYSAYFG
ncbi:cyclin-dependent kinase inhibitor 1C [Drosophila serrata]|uniref:cyclin-dependent kinase inhibitor 1C n=1 Tax=Drosophila serrata TaxID=7274 RepID=UPI000A1D01E4|nr:cyclin-dependent kinase inhibitor 1C [Drosophila serrata]KAH8394051.1 hypothetical protein KR200_004988 [Drosophila serrata]